MIPMTRGSPGGFWLILAFLFALMIVMAEGPDRGLIWLEMVYGWDVPTPPPRYMIPEA